MAKKKASKKTSKAVVDQYEITITVDENDADYLTLVSEISSKDLEKIKPLIKAIKAFKPYATQHSTSYGYKFNHHHNYPVGECCREDLGEKPTNELYPQFDGKTHQIFKDHCKWGENGFHTIKSVLVGPVTKKTKLL